METDLQKREVIMFLIWSVLRVSVNRAEMFRSRLLRTQTWERYPLVHLEQVKSVKKTFSFWHVIWWILFHQKPWKVSSVPWNTQLRVYYAQISRSEAEILFSPVHESYAKLFFFFFNMWRWGCAWDHLTNWPICLTSFDKVGHCAWHRLTKLINVACFGIHSVELRKRQFGKLDNCFIFLMLIGPKLIDMLIC